MRQCLIKSNNRITIRCMIPKFCCTCRYSILIYSHTKCTKHTISFASRKNTFLNVHRHSLSSTRYTNICYICTPKFHIGLIILQQEECYTYHYFSDISASDQSAHSMKNKLKFCLIQYFIRHCSFAP